MIHGGTKSRVSIAVRVSSHSARPHEAAGHFGLSKLKSRETHRRTLGRIDDEAVRCGGCTCESTTNGLFQGAEVYPQWCQMHGRCKRSM